MYERRIGKMKSLGSYILIYPQARTIEVHLSYRSFEKDNLHFAECPELELIDQGKSTKEAVKNLQNMISITLVSAIETGILDEMLTNLGFKRAKVPVPSIEIYDHPAESFVDFNPLEFIETLTPELVKKESAFA
jgi:hypothetical protein